MKLIKLEVYTNSDREEVKTIVLNPDLISSAALHPHEDKPELVLADYAQTSFFLTQNGVKTLLASKELTKLEVWQNTEKLKKVLVLAHPKQLAYLDVNNGHDFLFLADGSPLILTDKTKKEVETNV